MKKILLLVAIALIGCKENKTNLKEDDFENKLSTELDSGIRNDTIFLGYTFGMTKSEFESMTRDLQKEKKLYVNKYKQLAYKMVLDDDDELYDAEAVFSPEFYNDKLYNLTVSVKSLKNMPPELIQLKLALLFFLKNGSSYHIEKSVVGDYNNYYWVDGNRQIEITLSIDDALIYYTDLIAEKDIKQEKELEVKETTSDL